jgi:hypothetical protein
VSDIELDSQTIADITESLAKENKIEAIKKYRKATGKGLKESKEFIDQLIPGLVEKDPERFDTVAQNGSGCAGVVSAILTSVTWAVVLIWLC